VASLAARVCQLAQQLSELRAYSLVLAAVQIAHVAQPQDLQRKRPQVGVVEQVPLRDDAP
jgi:hypothetical protein